MLTLPSTEQVAWHDMELGLLICFDMLTYAPDWNWRIFKDVPSPTLFAPTNLDTDQWMEAAVAMGAKYAVLTAQHCSGFCMWPTDAYDYSVKQSGWRDGKGDVVGDFMASCHKAGIRPGIYYSVAANGYLHADGGRVQPGAPQDQAEYVRICEQQITELWTRYGDLAEVWFDGSTLPVDQGGPDVVGLLAAYQPHAVVFQSIVPTIRWVGNEDGVAPYPCWATLSELDTRGEGSNPQGDPDGAYWCPGECDVPIRHGEWFWKPDQQDLVKTTEHLMDCYYRSVGHNCNLFVGANPDRRGLVPEPDMRRYGEFGAEIESRFGASAAETKGTGSVLELTLDEPVRVTDVLVMEDIAQGQRVRAYRLDGLIDGVWREIGQGSSVGHKRIQRIEPAVLQAVCLTCTDSLGEPQISRLAVFSNG